MQTRRPGLRQPLIENWRILSQCCAHRSGSTSSPITCVGTPPGRSRSAGRPCTAYRAATGCPSSIRRRGRRPRIRPSTPSSPAANRRSTRVGTALSPSMSSARSASAQLPIPAGPNVMPQVLTDLGSRTSVLSQPVWRIRKRSGRAGSRSTTWTGVQAHCHTLMPGVRENWICPRVPSTATRGQDSAVRARSAP